MGKSILTCSVYQERLGGVFRQDIGRSGERLQNHFGNIFHLGRMVLLHGESCNHILEFFANSFFNLEAIPQCHVLVHSPFDNVSPTPSPKPPLPTWPPTSLPTSPCSLSTSLSPVLGADMAPK